jgi:hypothetical protein
MSNSKTAARRGKIYFSYPQTYNFQQMRLPKSGRLSVKLAVLLAAVTAAITFAASCGNTTSSPVADTPTEAYKRLYNAVKSKNTDEIKKSVSSTTLQFAEMAAQRQGKTLETVLENGFTATTFSQTMPEIRDERVKGNFGAVEVWNSKDSVWEDLPFVFEDGAFKLAVGDLFKGTFQSPGKGRDRLEKEAANAANPPPTPVNGMANTNMMPNPRDANKKSK